MITFDDYYKRASFANDLLSKEEVERIAKLFPKAEYSDLCDYTTEDNCSLLIQLLYSQHVDLVGNSIYTNDNKTVDFDSWDYCSVKDLEHDKAILDSQGITVNNYDEVLEEVRQEEESNAITEEENEKDRYLEKLESLDVNVLKEIVEKYGN